MRLAALRAKGKFGRETSKMRVPSKGQAYPQDTIELSSLRRRPRRNYKPLLRRGFALALLCASGHFGGPQSAWAAGPSSSQPSQEPVPTQVESAEQKWYRSPVEVLINARNLEREGEVGDYSWKMESMETKFRVKPKVKWGKAQVSAQSRVELFKGQLSKTEQHGPWKATQGLTGLVQFEGEYGYKTEDWGKQSEEVSKHNLTVHLGAFKSWSRTVSENTTLTVSTGAGASLNCTTGHASLYAQSRQKLQGENLELFGQTFDWSAEARQRMTVNPDSGAVGANYEIFAGLEKSFPVKIFKYEGDVTLKAGAKVSGNLNEPVHFSPATRVKLDF